jgi:hypothetical protein
MARIYAPVDSVVRRVAGGQFQGAIGFVTKSGVNSGYVLKLLKRWNDRNAGTTIHVLDGESVQVPNNEFLKPTDAPSPRRSRAKWVPASSTQKVGVS